MDADSVPGTHSRGWIWLVAVVVVVGVGGYIALLISTRPSRGTSQETREAPGASRMTPELIAARNKDIEVRAAAARPLLAKLSSKTDDMSETTWFEDRASKGRVRGNVARFYFGRFESKTHAMTGTTPFGPLRFEARYEGERWIFAEDLILKVDGQLHYLHSASASRPDGCRWNRHVFSDGSLWEWCDVPLSSLDADLAKALASASEAKIRFEGTSGVKDWNVPKAQLAAMKRVYDVWIAQPR